jgi:nucleotide-binding universal stress UspA family protein
MINYEELGYDKVFASLDGTECQDNVFRRAMEVAAANNAELYVGHVIDSTALETAGTYPVDLIPALEKSFRESIDPLLAEAESEPRIKKVEVMVRTGRIRETLKEEMLDVIHPDIVICGARGLSSIKYALLGSISTYLLRNAECDILVVK